MRSRWVLSAWSSPVNPLFPEHCRQIWSFYCESQTNFIELIQFIFPFYIQQGETHKKERRAPNPCEKVITFYLCLLGIMVSPKWMNFRKCSLTRPLAVYVPLLTSNNVSSSEKDFPVEVVCFHNIRASYGCWGVLTASKWSGTKEVTLYSAFEEKKWKETFIFQTNILQLTNKRLKEATMRKMSSWNKKAQKILTSTGKVSHV